MRKFNMTIKLIYINEEFIKIEAYYLSDIEKITF